MSKDHISVKLGLVMIRWCTRKFPHLRRGDPTFLVAEMKAEWESQL